MSPVGAIFVPFPLKTGQICYIPSPSQSSNGSAVESKESLHGRETDRDLRDVHASRDFFFFQRAAWGRGGGGALPDFFFFPVQQTTRAGLATV